MTRFKVGISEPVNTVLALWMAEAGGFYAAQGLAVEITSTNGGSRGAAELQSGRIDAMHVGLSSVVKLNEAGGDLRTIASLSNVIRFTFFTAPGVKTAADLKGGVVGVSAFGSESDFTVTLALARLGMRRDDVVLREYGGGMRRLEALKSGEIRGTAINEPIASLAHEQGFNPLVDLVAEKIPWLFSSIVVKRSVIDAIATCWCGFSRPRSRAITWRSRTKSAPRRCSPKRSGSPIRRSSRRATTTSSSNRPSTWSRRGRGRRTSSTSSPRSGAANIDDYVDTGLLDALKKEGFFVEMERKYAKR